MIALQVAQMASDIGEREYQEDLATREHFWVDHQPFLLSRGYQLRPRYDPGWIPSWELYKRPKNDCPDRIPNRVSNLRI